MKNFVLLYKNLDSTLSTNLKVEALINYFLTTPKKDAAWGLNFLLGKRQKRIITSKKLRDIFLINFPHFPTWLLEESYNHVGDSAETISLLLDSEEVCLKDSIQSISLSFIMEQHIKLLEEKNEMDKANIVLKWMFFI